eukprot:1194302-Prorocentrum_minimum.AAC.7
MSHWSPSHPLWSPYIPSWTSHPSLCTLDCPLPASCCPAAGRSKGGSNDSVCSARSGRGNSGRSPRGRPIPMLEHGYRKLRNACL